MSRPNVMFLPGWGFDTNVWQPLSCLKESAELHYIDWNGIESSKQINERVVEALSKEERSFNLIGWSLGALVALKVAKRYPEKVNCLILFSGTSCFTRQEGYDFGWDSRVIKRMKRRLIQEQEATLEDFYQLMYSSKEKKEGWNREEQIQAYRSKDTVSSLNYGLDYLLENDYREVLTEIKQPILLIHGEEDVICPPMASEYIARHSPNARKKQLIETGHLPFHTNANKCLEWVKEFIQEGVTCD